MNRTRRALFGLLAGIAALAIVAVIAWRARDTILYHYTNLRDPPTSPADRGDGGSAQDLLLYDPGGIGQDEAGNIYVADRGRKPNQGSVIWKIDPSGTAHAVGGTGRRGLAPTGVPALQSDLGMVEGLTVDRSGRIYFVDHLNHVLLRIETDGTLTRVAGTGRPGFSGDGGPAQDAMLKTPYDVRQDSKGNLYIADTYNHRIRKVGAEGIITTVAGMGEAGFAGDKGPATAARLNRPYNILIDGADRLLIADSYNHVVRRVDERGIITTIVGSGRQGYDGDGGPALQAKLDAPQALFVDAGSRLYVGDEHNHAVRILDPDGRLSHLAGTGQPGFAADGTAAHEAPLNDPEGLLVRDDGSIIILDSDNGRVLKIDRDGQSSNFAGRARETGG